MFVMEKFRKQKIGKLILNSIIKWFKEKGISSIKLSVYKGNANAVETYRRCGFKDFILEMKYFID